MPDAAHQQEADTRSPSPRRGLGSQLSLEFASIAVGVLFALAVNDWRENRAAMDTARQALANISGEIAVNQRHLQIAHTANLALQKEWQESLPEDTQEAQFFSPAWGLQSSAWKVAEASGALNPLEFQTVSSIAGIYVFQETYLGLVRQIAQAQMMALLIRDDEDPRQALARMDGKLRLYLDALISSEAQLLELYNEALRRAGRSGLPLAEF